MGKQKALLVPVGTQRQHGQVELRWKRIISQHLLTFRFSGSPLNLLNVNKGPALFGFWGYFLSPIPCCTFGVAAIPCAGNLLPFGNGDETPFLWLSAMKSGQDTG